MEMTNVHAGVEAVKKLREYASNNGLKIGYLLTKIIEEYFHNLKK